MSFTVTSKGRQFDRLGIMYLGDNEVFRTSTAEPTANGIVWTYVKEMQQYNALWKTEQKLIFDLGNLIDSTYTGSFNTTLTATFFTVPDSYPTADIILPISRRLSAQNQASAFTVPPDSATVSYTLPQNIQKAVVSLSACGQATEEFWYANALSSQVNTFESTAGTLYGFSPFREVQLLIDGQLAGVSWPFPVIFTGGIVPGLWRPIVGIDAFDLREHEIDITPWLPNLCDGAPHSFEIRVVGLNDDGNDHASLSQTVGSNWVVTGKIFIFSDRAGSITRGSSPRIKAAPPDIRISSSITTNSTGANQTLTYNTQVFRSIDISSTVLTSGGAGQANWSQGITYTNQNVLSAQGFTQITKQDTSGHDGFNREYGTIFQYPLNVESSFSVDATGNVGINATLSRGAFLNVVGPSVFPSGIQNFNITTPSTVSIPGQEAPPKVQLPSGIPVFTGASINTKQTGFAKYLSAGNASYSFGTTSQDFRFDGTETGPNSATDELYRRSVKAVNSTVVRDNQTLFGKTYPFHVANARPGVALPVAGSRSVRSLLGRGPGDPKVVLVGPGVSTSDEQGNEDLLATS